MEPCAISTMCWSPRTETSERVNRRAALRILGLVCLAAACRAEAAEPLFLRTFDDRPPGDPGPGWLLTGGEWRIEGSENRALRQVERELFQEAFALAAWSQPDVLCRFRAIPGTGGGGAGVVAQCQGIDRYYALAAIGGELHLLKRWRGYVASLATVPVQLQPGQWHWLRLQVALKEGRAQLSGKLWQKTEPEQPLVSATDESAPLTRGSAGLWCANVDCSFDRFELRDERQQTASFVEAFESRSPGELPAQWRAAQGRWFADSRDERHVLRHPGTDGSVSFDENALALARPRDYTVTSLLRRDTDARAWGAGLVAYCSGPDSHYRLRVVGERLYLSKRWDAEHAENLAETKFALQPEQWSHLKLRVRTLTDGVQLLGRAWTGNVEPDEWTLTAFDGSQPLPGGSAGLWAFIGQTSFDEFRVVGEGERP
jgi:hypothetical protein